MFLLLVHTTSLRPFHFLQLVLSPSLFNSQTTLSILCTVITFATPGSHQPFKVTTLPSCVYHHHHLHHPISFSYSLLCMASHLLPAATSDGISPVLPYTINSLPFLSPFPRTGTEPQVTPSLQGLVAYRLNILVMNWINYEKRKRTPSPATDN